MTAARRGGPGRGAVRTCIACREASPREELIHLVQSPEGELVVDLRAKLPGRGAWVHPAHTCVASLERRPGLVARAFKGATGGVTGLEERLERAVYRAFADGLSLAAAAGRLVSGRDALEQALRAGEVQDVVLAVDVSPRTKRELLGIEAGRPVQWTQVAWTSEQLGECIGRSPRVAVGAQGGGATSHLRRQLRRIRQLSR